MPQHVRLFTDGSLLCLKYADMIVALGFDLALIPLSALDLAPRHRPMMDDDGWQLHDENGEPRSYVVPSPWTRHSGRIAKFVDGPYINACCGSEADADRVFTPAVRNVYLTDGCPSAPAELDSARGYDQIVVPTSEAFDAWDHVAQGSLSMVTPGVPAHLERLREALVGANPF